MTSENLLGQNIAAVPAHQVVECLKNSQQNMVNEQMQHTVSTLGAECRDDISIRMKMQILNALILNSNTPTHIPLLVLTFFKLPNEH